MKFVRSSVGTWAGDVVGGWHGGGWIVFALGGSSFVLGGLDALVGLNEMAFDSFCT